MWGLDVREIEIPDTIELSSFQNTFEIPCPHSNFKTKESPVACSSKGFEIHAGE
jgi:hypothetical protein